MKKLFLIVVLAVVASRFIHVHDVRHHVHRAIRDSPIHTVLFNDDDRSWTARTEPVRSNPPPPPPPEPRSKSKRRGPRDAPAEATARAEAAPRVTPGWFPRSDADEERLAQADSSGVRVLLGRLSISPARAQADLNKTVQHAVADWLAADVPMTWTPPADLLDRMVLATYTQPMARNLGPSLAERLATPKTTAAATDAPPLSDDRADWDEVHTLYRAGDRLDFSENRRDELIERYHRDVASVRLRRLGSVMAVVLAGLAVVSVYVRTDEATRGYYTNRLRVLALGSLAAAGFAAHHYWA